MTMQTMMVKHLNDAESLVLQQQDDLMMMVMMMLMLMLMTAMMMIMKKMMTKNWKMRQRREHWHLATS